MLAHVLDANRTPECGLFLRGMCGDPSCRYLHVKKNAEAPDCEDFLTSWCPRGTVCPKRHYVPPPKRPREEPESVEMNEDDVLRQIWHESSTLNIYD